MLSILHFDDQATCVQPTVDTFTIKTFKIHTIILDVVINLVLAIREIPMPFSKYDGNNPLRHDISLYLMEHSIY